MTTKPPYYFLGIMSGTSCDAIDVAIIRADNHQCVHFYEHPMPQELREPIFRLAAPGWNEIDSLGGLDRALGLAFADAALAALAEKGLSSRQVLAIGSHGQTIRHRPHGMHGEHAFSLQIACPASIAEKTALTVVSDFRRRDIAAGGEGAPLVPFAHQQLFQKQTDATAILNIGGIANITMFNENGSVQGFDTGPGNMLMDALILHLSDGRHAYDKNGDLARSGKVCQALLEELLQHPFIKLAPPKSTGREDFGQQVLDKILAWPDISDADRMASCCAFTVQCVKKCIDFLHSTPQQWVICGGGARNTYLMQSLQTALEPAKVSDSQHFNIAPDAVEAIAFALLAKQTLLGKNNTIAEATGAEHAVCGGQITPGNNWRDVLQWIGES